MTDVTTTIDLIPIEELILDTERTIWECEQALMTAKAHEEKRGPFDSELKREDIGGEA